MFLQSFIQIVKSYPNATGILTIDNTVLKGGFMICGHETIGLPLGYFFYLVWNVLVVLVTLLLALIVSYTVKLTIRVMYSIHTHYFQRKKSIWVYLKPFTSCMNHCFSRVFGINAKQTCRLGLTVEVINHQHSPDNSSCLCSACLMSNACSVCGEYIGKQTPLIITGWEWKAQFTAGCCFKCK